MSNSSGDNYGFLQNEYYNPNWDTLAELASKKVDEVIAKIQRGE